MAFDRAPIIALLLSAALTVFACPARADVTSSQKQLARDLMKRGNELRAAHDFARAFDAFRSADDIMHVPTTGFEVARSNVALGRLIEARDAIARVVRIPAQPDEPQAFKDAREYARLLDAEIEPRIPKIRVRVEVAAGARRCATYPAVQIDGENVPITAFDIPYLIDPGRHTIEARAADGRTAKQEVMLREGEQRDVVLTVAMEKTTARRTAPPTSSAQPHATSTLDHRALAWIAFGTAGAAALVGGVTGVVSIADKGSAAAQCRANQCPPSTYGDLDAAQTFATISNVSFVVAGIAAVGGVVSLITAPKTRVNASTATTWVPWIGIGTAGVNGAF
jgi:hypothetical protein